MIKMNGKIDARIAYRGGSIMAGNYRCCMCNNISSGDEIDEKTIGECCMNRTDRRKYIQIDKTIKSSPKWYKCPNCGSKVNRRGWVVE